MTENQHVIPCSEAVRQLWDYLDQAVSPEDQAKVEQHLSFCRSCCGELEFANQLREFLASQSAEELPPHIKARLERFLTDLKEDQWRGI
jgi:anti-sigma factor (TIGR02949 family)